MSAETSPNNTQAGAQAHSKNRTRERWIHSAAPTNRKDHYMNTISFFVNGVPKPKGSGRAVLLPGRQWPVIVNACNASKPWARSITLAARAAACKQTWIPNPNLNYSVLCWFWMPRVKAHYRKGKYASLLCPTAPRKHVTQPDLDKLIRLAVDALTGTIWTDDSQVTEISATKQFTENGISGLEITVTEGSL